MSFTLVSTVAMAGSSASSRLKASMFASLSSLGSSFARMMRSPSPLGVMWAPITQRCIVSATCWRRVSSLMLPALSSR